MAQDTRRRRVGAELHRLLNELLRTEVKDPRLDDVTVSDVEMSGDLGVAKVYFTMLDPDAPAEEAEAGFYKASGFLRGRIGHTLRLRRTPELHFIRDESARRGAELTRLIDSLSPGGESSSAEEDLAGGGDRGGDDGRYRIDDGRDDGGNDDRGGGNDDRGGDDDGNGGGGDDQGTPSARRRDADEH